MRVLGTGAETRDSRANPIRVMPERAALRPLNALVHDHLDTLAMPYTMAWYLLNFLGTLQRFTRAIDRS
jgi:hypothetical protein